MRLERLSLSLVVILAALPSNSAAQPVAGTISTHGLVVYGPSQIDAAGNVYATGNAGPPPTAGGAQTQPGGGTCTFAAPPVGLIPEPCPDAVIVKYDPSGNLVFSTLLGGPASDGGTAITMDSAGNIYVAGTTGGSFPTTANAAIPVSSTSTTFAAKVSPDGSKFLWVTYLPDLAGSAAAICTDRQGNAYITGTTTANHAYVTAVSADGSSFVYTRVLAGSNQESGSSMVCDAAGNVVAAGTTTSPDFPVSAGAVQPQLMNRQNAFVSKLDPNGNLVVSTFLGGGDDVPNAVQTDAAGNIYVAGSTASLVFPTTPNAFQPAASVPLWNQLPGGFLTKLAPDLSAIGYSTYVPSMDAYDIDYGIPGVSVLAVAPSGDVYIAGTTGAGFPITSSAPQPCFAGIADVFLAHVNPQGTLQDATYFGTELDDVVYSIARGSDGSLNIVWHNAGPYKFARITFGSGGWTAPGCVSPDTLNSATLRGFGPPAALAPGELVTLTGLGIGPDQGVSYQPDAQGQVPRTLAGTTVFFDGNPAPVLYAQSQQVNVLAPFELSGQSSTTITVQYNGATLGPITVTVAKAAPGLFRFQPNVSEQAYAVNQDGTFNSSANPAAPASVLALWGTGFGPTDPPCATGGLNLPTAASLEAGYTAMVFDGRSIPALYAGSAPTLLCGVEQINIAVPAVNSPNSSLSLSPGTASVGGPSTSSTIAVK